MITYNNLGHNGRFGNQLFQYASLCGIATKNNYEYGVPYENNLTTDEYHRFCLPDCFSNLKAKNSKNFKPQYLFSEQQFNYDENLFKIPDNTDILSGYFQSEKYFKHCKDDIKIQYTFNSNIQKIGNIFLEEFKNCKILSIHLRLSDYVSSNGRHPVCSIDYYKKALDQFSKDCTIFVFSDEINKAKEVFNNLDRKIYYPSTNDKFVDMYLMTKCNYHIIANSSFSWWGAWLAESEKTVAPTTWFGNMPGMPQNWSDIYCDDWIVL